MKYCFNDSTCISVASDMKTDMKIRHEEDDERAVRCLLMRPVQ